MSMELMVKAMKLKVGNPLRKLVLLKLADNASDQGECWPSYQHIADQCEISRRSVIAHIKVLGKSGFLKINNRKSTNSSKPNSSNLFVLTLNKGGESPALGGESPALGGESPALGGGESPAPRTSHSFEPVNESNSDSAANGKKQTNTLIDSAFDRFWSAGLLKVGKQKAHVAFLTNLKKSKRDAESFAGLLAEDIEHRLLANQFGFDRLHPITYLNQRRWEDEQPEIIPFDRIVEAYHRNLPNNVPVTALSDRRREFLACLWTQRANRELGWFDEFFAFCASQSGLNGVHRADLEWLTDPNNYPRITENARGTAA